MRKLSTTYDSPAKGQRPKAEGRRARFTNSPFFRKLISGIKSWHLGHVRYSTSNRQRNLGLLNHAPKIPGVSQLIRRLVIVCGVVGPKLLFAPTFWPANIIVAFLQTDRRYADLGKRKMIRTKE